MNWGMLGRKSAILSLFFTLREGSAEANLSESVFNSAYVSSQSRYAMAVFSACSLAVFLRISWRGTSGYCSVLGTSAGHELSQSLSFSGIVDSTLCVVEAEHVLTFPNFR